MISYIYIPCQSCLYFQQWFGKQASKIEVSVNDQNQRSDEEEVIAGKL